MKHTPMAILFDSFALLAYLENENGAARVTERLRQAAAGQCRILMTAINLGEVLYITERERGLPMAHRVLALVESLPITVMETENALVFEAAHIKATHRLSYADAFAVAAALREDAAILTGDPEFRCVEELVKIEWLEKKMHL